MKIITRLLLSSIAFAVVIVAIGLVTAETFSRVNEEINESRDASILVKDVFELNTVAYQYTMHHEKRMQQQYQIKYGSIGKLLNSMIRKELHPECRSIIASIMPDYKALRDLFSQLQVNFDKRKSLIKENRPKIEINMTLAIEERLVTQTFIRAQKMVSGVSEISDIMQKRLTGIQQKANLIVLFSVIGFIVLSTCISFLTIRSITVPINTLVKGTDIIGAGNLEHKLGIETKDEIGRLSRAFERMIENLKKITASRDELEREIAERKQAEENLKKSETFLNAVFDSIQDGISVLDQDLNIVRVNQAMRNWYAHMLPLEGKKCYEVYHGRSDVCEICPTVRALKTEKLEMDEVPLTQADGVAGTLELFAFPMLSESGQPAAVVEYVRDVTVRNRAEKEREKLIKELQEALKEINTLRGILPLCSFCKKIRDDTGYWEQIDVYIHKHSQADISHSICPECAKDQYPDLEIFE